MAATGSGSSKRVNDLLATSRAEHARHIQNLARVARRAPPPPVYSPTLPFLLPAPATTPEPPILAGGQPAAQAPKKPAGPPPPRSWVHSSTASSSSIDLLAATPESSKLREELLSFIFRRLPSSWEVEALPTLVDWCVLSLLDPFDEEAIQELPSHLRQKLIRLAAIRRPLFCKELRICWGEDYSGTGGEAIVLGREAYGALRELLRALNRASEAPPPVENWDTPMYLLPSSPLPVLHTLVLVRTPLPSFSLLPRTLTHLSLVRCTFDPIRTARHLPKALPLLEWLEIQECEGVEGGWFETLDWPKWTGLRGVRLSVVNPLPPAEGGETPRRIEAEGWKVKVRKRIEAGRVGEVEIWLE